MHIKTFIEVTGLDSSVGKVVVWETKTPEFEFGGRSVVRPKVDDSE